jgi:hypothetical protein
MILIFNAVALVLLLMVVLGVRLQRWVADRVRE